MVLKRPTLVMFEYVHYMYTIYMIMYIYVYILYLCIHTVYSLGIDMYNTWIYFLYTYITPISYIRVIRISFLGRSFVSTFPEVTAEGDLDVKPWVCSQGPSRCPGTTKRIHPRKLTAGTWKVGLLEKRKTSTQNFVGVTCYFFFGGGVKKQ